MKGRDVQLLQSELTQLGFSISTDEMNNDLPDKSLFGDSTKTAVMEIQKKNRFEATGIVDKNTADLINSELDRQRPKSFKIQGHVTDRRGKPVRGIRIVAIDKDLRGEEMLGEQVTDQQGNYEIQYSFDGFSHAEKDTADLFFKLFDRDGNQLTIFSAKDDSGSSLTALDVMDDKGTITTIFIKYNASEDQTVDFLVRSDSGNLSEYWQLLKKLEPLLVNVKVRGQDTVSLVDKLADIKKDEIDFLSGETDINRQRIEFLCASAKLQQKAAEKQLTVSAETFYGLARTKGIIEFEGLAHISIVDLRTALIKAGGLAEHPGLNIITSFESEEKLNDAVGSIQRLATEYILTTSTVNSAFTLAQVLTPVLPSIQQQLMLLQSFANRDGTVEEFWSNLRQNNDFQEQGKVEKVQFQLQLNVLTQNNLLLINAMQSKFHSTQEMARLDQEELKVFIKQGSSDLPANYPGDAKEAKLDLYARRIVGLLQGAFPTETIASVITKVSDVYLTGAAPSTIALFLTRASDPNVVPTGEKFDIRTTRIDLFLDKHGDKIFASFDGDVDKVKLIAQVKRLQRLFQVSTSPETFQTLVESRHNSANDIAKTSLTSLKEEFREKIDVLDLELIHRRAMAATASSLHLALQVYQSVTDVNPMVVGQA
jgi:Putative peptidoglycan binding domain